MSKLKPAIAWGLVGGWWNGSGFKILTITSERGSMVFGRDESGMSTHVAARDLFYRFKDEASAQGARQRANAKKNELEPAVLEARKNYEALSSIMQDAILAAAKGEAK